MDAYYIKCQYHIIRIARFEATSFNLLPASSKLDIIIPHCGILLFVMNVNADYYVPEVAEGHQSLPACLQSRALSA